MDVTQTAVQAATDALLRVIDRLLIAGGISQLLLAFAIYFLVLALVRAYRGGGSGSVVIPTQPPGTVAPPVAIPPPAVVPPAIPAPVAHPDIALGATGPAVSELQQILGVDVDGQFGDDTAAAVRAYQASHGLDADGEVGDDTWAALLSSKPAVVPTSTNVVLSADVVSKITQIASSSSLAHYSWSGRGTAPEGYITGLAVAFGNVYAKWKAGNSSALVMAQAAGNPSSDALAWYDATFSSVGMNNKTAGADTLRHLFVLLAGLGMRESSGNCFEGRDTSASNVSADTAEAGLFQQSWNSNTSSPELPKLFAQWSANPADFLSIFAVGVQSTAAGLANYGSGQGEEFQALCKSCPAFAVEMAAVGLRVLRSHWGPIVRQEAQVRPEADQLFQQVQAIVDEAPAASSSPGDISPVAPPVSTPTPAPSAPAAVSGVPPWVTLGRSFEGLTWNSGPMPAKIQTWMDNIATCFPEMAPYANGLKTAGLAGYWEWCGGFVQSMLAYSNIRGPISAAGLTGEQTTGDWAYVDAWRTWGTKVWDAADGTSINDASPQIGDVLIWYVPSVIHHVSFYNEPEPTTNSFSSLGGDQGKPLRVSIEDIPMSYCVGIRRAT